MGCIFNLWCVKNCNFTWKPKRWHLVYCSRSSYRSFKEHLRSNHQTSTFKPNNTSIYTTRMTWAWLRLNFVSFLDWPACSPDLNPVKNVWGVIVRKMYKHGNQYTNVSELKLAILDTWDNFSHSLLQKFDFTRRKRYIKDLQKLGGKTSY